MLRAVASVAVTICILGINAPPTTADKECTLGRTSQGRASLPVEQLAKKAKTLGSVGGGKTVEGFVAPFGAFRLGGNRWEAMVMLTGSFPNPAFFQKSPLVSHGDYTDPATGITGTIYHMVTDDGTGRWFLFGSQNLPPVQGLVQRYMIVFDEKGNIVTRALPVNYATGLSSRRAPASGNTKPPPVPPPQACAHAPHDTLCSDIPHDVVAAFGFGYSQLAPDQRPFDNFAWQSFVALNWPADNQGKPLKASIITHPEAPRVWEFYKTPFEVFGHARPELTLEPTNPLKRRRVFHMMSTRSNESKLIQFQRDNFLEATGQPLIDRHLNFVMYDIVMNPVEVRYIIDEGLDTKKGQKKFKDDNKKVSFPLGYYKDPMAATGGEVGAIEIKTAWRVLDCDRDDAKRYFTLDGEIYVDGKYTVTGKPLLLREKMGLVAMHIIQRTTGPYTLSGKPFPQDWIWATFEHVDNAPDAGNARDATDIKLPLPATATAPTGISRRYSFFDPHYMGPTNVPPQPAMGESVYKWQPRPPYASLYANDKKFGTQVVRAWKIYPPTDEVNKYFQKLLKGTVWANYQLIGSQWMGGTEVPETENGNIPRYLSNTTLETYIQFNSSQQKPPTLPEGSCLQCHQGATTTAGQSANFSFLLGRAR
jgi:hypothetical protein